MLTPDMRRALELARARLAQGRNSYICMALDWVATFYPEYQPAAHKLQFFINDALAPAITLGSWQFLQGMGHRGVRQRDADRLAWIDWLLNEPENPQ